MAGPGPEGEARSAMRKPQGDAQRGMMMEAAPPSPLVMTEPEFLLKLLVVALDAPAELCHVDQAGEGHIARQGGEPVFGRFRLALGPFDEEPFLGSGFGEFLVAMGGADPHPGVARDQPVRRALESGDGFPGLCRKRHGQRLGLDRLVRPPIKAGKGNGRRFRRIRVSCRMLRDAQIG